MSVCVRRGYEKHWDRQQESRVTERIPRVDGKKRVLVEDAEASGKADRGDGSRRA